jgi:pilus assembly protein CpaF
MISEEIILNLRDLVRGRLDLSNSTTDDEMLQVIEESVFQFSQQQYLTAKEKQECVNRIVNSFRGLDVLQPLVDDKSITEIMINNYDEIFIERDGHVHQYAGKFESREKLEDIIQLIVGKVNRVVNEASPIVDARLYCILVRQSSNRL